MLQQAVVRSVWGRAVRILGECDNQKHRTCCLFYSKSCQFDLTAHTVLVITTQCTKDISVGAGCGDNHKCVILSAPVCLIYVVAARVD
jgi:hypothetical protein